MKRILILAVVLITLFNGCKKADQPVWILKLKSRSYTTPIIRHGRFFVFSQAGEVICGNLKPGTTIWKKTLPDPILGDPAISNDDLLYIITQNGLFYSLDSQTGNIHWRIKIEDTFISPITISGNILLLPSERGTLYARSATDGSELWKFSGAGKFSSAAVIANESILIGGWSQDFYSLKHDGTLQWKVNVADRITNSAVTSADVVLFSSYNRFVYGLDIPSGRTLWRYPVKSPSNLVLLDRNVYFASGKELIGLSIASGKLLRSRNFGSMIDRLYVDQPNVLALSSYVYEVDPTLTHASTVVRGFQPIFKLSSAEGMILACDSLYSIYGYGKTVP